MVRLLSGVVLALAFLALVWFSSAIVLLAVAMGVCLLAFQEYFELVKRLGAKIPRIPTLTATLAALVVVPFPHLAVEGVVGVGVVVIALATMVRSNESAGLGFSQAMLSTSAGVLAVAYLGLSLGMLVAIHRLGNRGAVLLLVFSIVVSDSAQYYAGRAFGRRPLAPHLSPKKTVEGALGGFVVTPFFVALVGPSFIPSVSALELAPLGLVLVAAGIAGDLFESMLKRAAEMKDSSALIPGHGGVLDRIDALLFATPVFYLYLRWLL
jgi:phosphatidate cytidylyltransferase